MTIDGTLVTTKNVQALLKGGIHFYLRPALAGLHVTRKFVFIKGRSIDKQPVASDR